MAFTGGAPEQLKLHSAISSIMEASVPGKCRGETGRSLGFSRLRILQRIQFPECLPSLLNGLRLGLGYRWRAIIGAEMIAAASGLGYWILDAEEMARIDVVFAGILVIGTLGIALDRLAYLIAARFLPWLDLRAQWYA